MPRAKERSPKKIARELENNMLHMMKVESGGLSRAERRELSKMGVPVNTTFAILRGEKEKRDEAIRLRAMLRMEKEDVKRQQMEWAERLASVHTIDEASGLITDMAMAAVDTREAIQKSIEVLDAEQS